MEERAVNSKDCLSDRNLAEQDIQLCVFGMLFVREYYIKAIANERKSKFESLNI